MSSRLLCYFNFNNYFYEIFIDKNSKIFCKKFGTQKEKGNISDVEVIKSVLNKISEMKYVFFDKIQHEGEELKLYLNLFNQKIYMSKIDNQKEVVCEYFKYKKIYDMYNNPIIYNYDFLNSNNSGSSFGDFGETSDFDTGEEIEDDYKIMMKKRREAELKKRNRNKKVIKIIVSGILVICIAISSVVMITEFKGIDIKNLNEDEINIELIIENTDDKILKKILESLSNEEPWVIEQVIEQYQAEKGILQPETDSETDKPSKEIKLSKKTKKVMESINTNTNLTEKEKRLIIERYSQYFENNLEYIEDIDKLCDTLNTIRFVYNIQEDDIEELERRGEYNPDTNEAIIYSDLEKVITHEIGHAIGDLGTGVTTGKLSEGYTELFNPNRDGSAYKTEQTMILILEQIYGKDFMRKAYFNRSLFSDIYSRFDIDKQDVNKHWNLIRKCNSFLVKYQDYALEGLKMDENILKEVRELLSELKAEYESVTGKKWEENELLKLCYDMFTGENTSEKNIGNKVCTIRDVYINPNGEYVYKIGKYISVFVDVTEPTPEQLINGEFIPAEIYTNTFNVESEEIGVEK